MLCGSNPLNRARHVCSFRGSSSAGCGDVEVSTFVGWPCC